jgi:hypothetical protein
MPAPSVYTERTMSDRKTALVTGASFGIGYELARLFARDHNNLVMVARTRERLHQIAAQFEKEYGTKSLIIASDLSVAGSAELVFEQTKKAGIAIDALVNNAGFGQYGMFVETDPVEMLQQIQLNVTSLTQLTHLYATGMIDKKSGRILNVASTAAFQPGPLMLCTTLPRPTCSTFRKRLPTSCRAPV